MESIKGIMSKTRSLNWNSLSQNRSTIMGVATLMIVAFHLAQMSDLISNGMIAAAFQTLCSGVEIFIFVTGMGLFYSLNKNPNLKQFYKKRFINIYPIYLIVALPYCIWWSVVNQKGMLFFVNWLAPNYIIGNARDIWYIPFILVMYLIYPLAYKALFSKQFYKFRYAAVIVISVIWYALMCWLYSLDNDYFNKIEIGLFRFPVFLFACLIGELVFKKTNIGRKIYLFIIFPVVGIVVIHILFNGLFEMRMTDALASITYLSILLLIFNVLKLKNIRKILDFFANMSIELYLVHLLIFKVLSYYSISKWYYYLIAILMSVLISYPLSLFRKLITKKQTVKNI